MKEVSSEFIDTFANSSSIVISCEYCGRVHFCDDRGAGDFEKGELEQLQRAATETPDRYIGYDYCPAWGLWDGKQAVIGCPCRTDERLESLVWSNRWWIMDFLAGRATVECKDATEMAERAANLIACLAPTSSRRKTGGDAL